MPTPYNACVDLLDRNVEAGFGERPAVMTRDRTVTYAELLDSVERAAAGLLALGVRPEERVAMVMLDSIEFYLVFLGAMRIGAIPVPLNPLLPGRDLGAIVAASRATVLVVSAERGGEMAAISSAAPEVPAVVVTRSPEWERLLAVNKELTPYASWDESPGFWLCTSGSTGSPKLAMHRHIDLRASFDSYASFVLTVSAGDRCYSVGPMFHAYGLGNSLTFPLLAGATAIIEPARPPSPALVAVLVGRFQPTLFFCIPTFYAALLASDLPDDTFASVRAGVSAAEPLPADTFSRFRDRFGVEVLDGIGSTEMTHIFVSNRSGAVRPGTSGQPVPGYDVALLDDLGGEAPAGTPGHLHVGGESMATGYWCASGPTRRAFQGERMRTGDMYERSPDGYYTYLGRSDDMLRVAGEWVSPAEVEAVLISHPGVLEAAVVGERDDLGVQRPVAYVVASAGVVFDVAELEVLCKAELAGYKRPRRFEVLPSLPKTATGKIQRYRLR
ncbi:MAG TPA: benzoate-CoA ligase family protein [Acidimicrobiales bacterium]|nr:benzoate-CoA ligase family protein [Acidimicrobiales bacterium]